MEWRWKFRSGSDDLPDLTTASELVVRHLIPG